MFYTVIFQGFLPNYAYFTTHFAQNCYNPTVFMELTEKKKNSKSAVLRFNEKIFGKRRDE